MKYFKYKISLLLLLFSFGIQAQEVDCNIENTAFQPGEKLKYVISYNWFFVWTDVGYANMTVKNDELEGKDILHIRGEGNTFPFYDWFFQVRDVYETWVDPVNLLPYEYVRDVDEDGYLIDITYDFEHDDTIAYSSVEKTNKPHFNDTVGITPCTYDVISIIYFARNIDFSKYEIDEKIPLKILLDNELTDVYIRYKGIERRKVRGLGKIECLKFTGSLIAGSVFKGGEDLTLWVSNDRNRIPVWVESPIIVGTIKVRLVSYSGTIEPLNFD